MQGKPVLATGPSFLQDGNTRGDINVKDGHTEADTAAVGAGDVLWRVYGRVSAGDDSYASPYGKGCRAGAEEPDLAGRTFVDDTSGVHADDVEQRDDIPGVADGDRGGRPVGCDLHALVDEWRDWVQNTDEGGFHSSLSPLLYSLSSSTVICVLLNLVIFDGPRRPFLQKFSITLSSVYLLTGFIFATRKLELQYNEGFQEGNLLRYELETSRAINILHVIFDTILLSMEVQTLMSLFPRQKEKRLIFWVGGALIVVSQVLWSVSVFDPNSNRKESALPAFVYLFQISISIMYFGCVVYYAVTKHRSAFNRSLGFFSFVSMLASVAPIALFIVDVGGWWVVEWTDSVSWLTSILSIVTVWEWARRVESRERHREKDRVLGRQIYEDEGQVLPKIFRSKSSSDDSDDRHNEDNDESGGAIELENLSQEEQTSPTRTKAREIVMNRMVMDNTPLEDNTDNPDAHRWYQTFRRAIISPFLWISDQIIELGYFGISRDSKSPASDNNNPQTTWDHPNDTESNHTTSSRQQMPRFVH
ncbi:hypothetical protein TRICI_004027 [Trichomonascus ciferrii]|uniref:pH-response regulator protein palH/RIM21 n=1 Tax=Trichomonascus ciferrii TaxID=44093 RepID=A0A642V291_9ASCO|nr:hypothetical protein TRICI_004027 [Trichomonascus ciferrii]